ncbi:hypothetical protein NMY22_g15614 [Coprinellus aureogranulatus]|nr:hypothetical protein NMY22_g15614 [Coprinellus aureogranulatus]
MDNVQDILQTRMPLTFRLFLEITGDLESTVDAGQRPGTVVVSHSLSSLLFKRSNEARILPLSVGLLAFAQSAPVDFMAYCSRTGYMPSYNAISGGLEVMAKDQAVAVREYGRDTNVAGFIVTDNVQNYLCVTDLRIGSGNKMNIGLAATYCVLRDIEPDVVKKALDIEGKRKEVEKNLRSTLTVPTLLGFIDMPHINTVFVLHWILTLVNHIPELAPLKPKVSELFRTRAKKLCIPEGATPVYPLSSSGKSETVTTELKDAMHDFLSQVGQDDGDYINRIIPVQGDGLTFQRLLEVQRYLQFHKDNRESLAITEPVLAFWHTAWTFLSSLFEVHDDGSHSPDPSSIGHSRTLIGRALPGNVKKIDFFPGVDIVNIILDTRMLDCWRLHYGTEDIFKHFAILGATKKLPSLAELEKVATGLHHAYTTTHAIYNVLADTTAKSRWTESVPLGSEWVPPTSNPTTAKAASATKPSTNGRHANGDRVLANSMTFMRDALLSREISYAMAEGDAGRVYEIMKMLLFYFAGGSHQKYCSYMLEVVTRFELESSPELMEMVLQTTLVNLSGLPGTCIASDIMQEYFNRLLEAIIEKKGIDYGDSFARRVISPNLAHFARLKLNLRSGVGLAARSGRHSAPNEDPEIRKLLDAYRTCELHKRRPGRVYKDTDRDDFTRGLTKLENGRLKKWVHNTLLQRASTRHISPDAVEDMGDVEDEDESEGLATLGMAEVIEGHLVVQTLSFTNDTAAV